MNQHKNQSPQHQLIKLIEKASQRYTDLILLLLTSASEKNSFDGVLDKDKDQHF